MKKPQTKEQALEPIGKYAKVTWEDGTSVTGKVTGVSMSEYTDMSYSEDGGLYSNVWYLINGKPKSYSYHVVDILNQEEQDVQEHQSTFNKVLSNPWVIIPAIVLISMIAAAIVMQCM